MYNDCNVSKLRESHKAMSTKRVFDMWPRIELGYGKNLLDIIDNPQPIAIGSTTKWKREGIKFLNNSLKKD
jgi:hypothetical protein